MGNAFSNPLDDSKQARMNEIINEVVAVFAKVFPLRYKDALIAKIKEEAQGGEEDDPNKLPPIPDPDYAIKEGTMDKRGDVVKNWKNRFFVALNKADNFVINYMEKEGGKIKGTINCCGYRAREYDEDETKEFGEFGIKLVPYNHRRRTWYMKAKDAADQEEWMRVFNNACSKAKAPVNNDQVLAAAFEGAYRAVRWNYGFYGWYAISGTEAETLGGLCCDILDRELINDVLYNIPAGPQRNTACSVVRKTVDTAVVAAVSACWNSVVGLCEGLRATLETTVKGLLNPLFEQEVVLKEKIVSSISGNVNPFLSDVGSRVCRPLLKVTASSITKAFCAAIKGYAHGMRGKIEQGNFTEASFATNAKWADREIEYWWSGPLEKSNQICWNIYTSDLADVASLFSSGGFTPYSVYSFALDGIRDLTHRAHYKFTTKAVENGYANLEAVLSEVLADMVHDAKLAEKVILNGILLDLLQPSVESNVIVPCGELVQPVQDLIDSIPVPGLSDLFNLPSLVEEVIGNVVQGSVSAIIDGSTADIEAAIDGAGSEVGV